MGGGTLAVPSAASRAEGLVLRASHCTEGDSILQVDMAHIGVPISSTIVLPRNEHLSLPSFQVVVGLLRAACPSPAGHVSLAWDFTS